jgi:uncharacterized protein (DUF1330 family)
MSGKGYVIVQVSDIHDPDAYATYRPLASETVARHGGRFLVRGGAAERIEGEGDCGRVVVLEFPSVAAAKAWYASPEYREALAIRLGASTAAVILVEGV